MSTAGSVPVRPSIVSSTAADSQPSQVEILEVLREAKVLARRYYDLTGKPLGITGEVAEYEAAMKLNLCLHPPRRAGYDATEVRQEGEVKIQIKGRCIRPEMSGVRWPSSSSWPS